MGFDPASPHGPADQTVATHNGLGSDLLGNAAARAGDGHDAERRAVAENSGRFMQEIDVVHRPSPRITISHDTVCMVAIAIF